MITSRFEVRPSDVLDGRWVVIDTERDAVARKGNDMLLALTSRTEAEKACAGLTALKVCKTCRHKRLAVDFRDGACVDCYKPPAAPPPPTPKRGRKGRR